MCQCSTCTTRALYGHISTPLTSNPLLVGRAIIPRRVTLGRRSICIDIYLLGEDVLENIVLYC
ncbi:hypothetical protein BDD12DRAFT_818748 [Trichophaea hybrida]|nr:hypothetical protein BDD12DRAFT_818748 [Trichophaea hybrida]